MPAHAPRDFHEALQHYWFIHLGVISEANPWDAFNPGRLDQHLLPFYRRGLADGTLDRERARELLQAFWVKFNNHPSPPKVGVTAEESGTYTDFALINTGGVDPEGEDGVNEVSFLILEVIEEMRLLQPSSMVQVSRKNPDAFLQRALKIVRTGFGQPSLFNSEALVAEMLRQGKSLADARRGGASGCVETGAFGREAYILTGYFNLVKVLEITLNNGRDPLSGRRIGLETGAPEEFTSFAGLLGRLREAAAPLHRHQGARQQRHRPPLRPRPAGPLPVAADRRLHRQRPRLPRRRRPLQHLLHPGGGAGNDHRRLSAIRHHVYDEKDLSMAPAQSAGAAISAATKRCASCC